jgi:hypothetical protein
MHKIIRIELNCIDFVLVQLISENISLQIELIKIVTCFEERDQTILFRKKKQQH